MKRYILFLLATLLSAAVSGQTAARTDSLAQHPQSEQTASAAYASDPDKLWDQANTAYINNDFPTAISLYETILSSGRQSGKLYYNLANAYFKEQEIGRAILNYNRALRLNPGNEDIRYNLQVAEKMTKDHIDAVPEFFVKTWLSNLRNLLSSTTWAVLSLVFLAAMLGSALFYLLSRRLVRRKIGFYGTATAFLLLVLTLCFAAIDRREAIDRTSAVVLRDAVAVKSSPNQNSTDLFILHQSRNFGPSERLVRNHHRRRQKGLDGVLDVRNHLKNRIRPCESKNFQERVQTASRRDRRTVETPRHRTPHGVAPGDPPAAHGTRFGKRHDTQHRPIPPRHQILQIVQ